MRQREKAIQSRRMHSLMPIIGMLIVLALLGIVFVQVPKQHVQAVAGTTGDWPTFLSDNARTGYNPNETTITSSTVPNLQLKWTYSTGGSISTQPMEANNMVYWGSWDGNEYAADLKGNKVWSTPISPLTPDCLGNARNFGVGSPATVATEPINGMTSVLYVGSSDGHLYALNATTGAVIWETSLSSVPHTFLWSNPLVYNGSVYIGISSVDDCPLVQGGIAQVDAVTGTIEHIFYDVPAGCLGGSIWSSPAVDEATGMIYVATGNAGACRHTTEIYASAVLEFRAADLTLVDSWQVPASQLGADSDFGATVTLFTAPLQGSQQAMVGVQNKNGTFYALEQNSLHSSPVWQASIGTGRRDIVSDAFDGSQLYVASLNTTIHGKHCYGSLRSLDPATGAFNWEDCLKGPVNTAVSVVPGVAFVGAGKSFLAMDTATGKILFSSKLSDIIYGSASISNGVAYIGDASGRLYAFGM